MPDDLLPLFPLQVVLLPGTLLPLHIFEDRYKKLIGAVLDNGREFGVVQASDKGIVNLGCTATIDQVLKRYDDGRMDLVTVGRRRFELFQLNDDEDYLRGEVQFFDDETEAPAATALRRRAVELYSALLAADPESEPVEFDPADPQLSFKLAGAVKDLPFRQQMLAMRSETERLEKLVAYLPQHAEKVQYVEKMKIVVPKNGHGKHPSGLE